MARRASPPHLGRDPPEVPAEHAGELRLVESDALDYLLAPVKRVCGMDIPMPYARKLEQAAIPQVDDVIDGAKELMKS